MKIDKVNCGSVQTFAGAQGVTKDLTRQVKDLLPSRKWINRLDKADNLRGEAGGILINAIGTGAVAPIFIAFNPFVKAKKNATAEEEKEVQNTKKYTAWRQPISAVLAILIQLGVQKPINITLDSIFNNPKLAKNLWLELDQSTLNNDSYLTRKIKKEMKKDSSLHFNNKKEFEAELAKRVKDEKTRQINSAITDLEQTGRIHIGERVVDNKIIADVLNRQIDSYIADAEELKNTTEGLKYYKNRAKLLMNNEEALTRILSNIPENEKEIETYLRQQIAQSDSQGVKTILGEIIEEPENLRASKCNRTLDRFKKIKDAVGMTENPNKKFNTEEYLRSMLRDNSELEKLIVNLKEAKIEDFDNISGETIKAKIKEIQKLCQYKEGSSMERVLHNTGTFRTNADELLKKIHTDVVNGYKNVVKNKYKGFNQLSKIFVGIAITTPITCTALNWVYPRFMDLFLPELSGKKKQKAEVK